MHRQQAMDAAQTLENGANIQCSRDGSSCRHEPKKGHTISSRISGGPREYRAYLAAFG